MPEDFEVNEKVSVLFLSLQYHISYPLYVVGRLDEVFKQRKHRNKILLCLVDNPDD